MAFVILMWVVVSGCLLFQGLFVIRTGQTLLFLVKRQHRHPPLGLLGRSTLAFLYLVLSLAMVVILGSSLKRNGFGPLRQWFGKNVGMLFWVFVLGIAGALYLAEPARMLRWTLRANPELAHDRRALVTARLIGLCLVVMVLFILAKL